jgi:hypothetical protein
MALCLPWWHTQFAALPRTRISSGCSLSGGNIQCAPESMRRAAEAKMRALGYNISLSLNEYSLARNISSEVGSGTPEEKVALGESTRNQANGNIVSVLLYRSTMGSNRGYYGSVGGGSGRWSSTARDPAIDDILIAKFVLAGKSKNFAKGANDQMGMDLVRKKDASGPRNSVLVNARQRDYWVGPLPGVNHWHTFLYARRPSIDPNSAEGRALVNRALAAVADTRAPDWSGLDVCRKPGSVFWPSLLVGIPLSLALYFFGRRRWWSF